MAPFFLFVRSTAVVTWTEGYQKRDGHFFSVPRLKTPSPPEMPISKSRTPSRRKSSQGRKRVPVASRPRRRVSRLSKLRGGVAPSAENVAQLKAKLREPLRTFIVARNKLQRYFATAPPIPDTLSVRSRDFIDACQTLDDLIEGHDKTFQWLLLFTQQFEEDAYVRLIKRELASFFGTYAVQVEALQQYCQVGKRKGGADENPRPSKFSAFGDDDGVFA